MNGDGFLDLFVVHGAEHPPFGVGPRELFINAADNGNHWIQLQLRGTTSNGSGVGARVRFVTAAGKQWRWRLGESDNCFSDQTILHAGLGAAATVDTLQVFWPAGSVQTFVDVAADQKLWVVEGDTLRPVLLGPDFDVVPDSLAATLTPSGTTSWTVDVENRGGAASVFGARTETCQGLPAPWIAVAPDTGGVWPGARTFTIGVDAGGLPLGSHCGRVIFNTDATAGPDTLVVDLTVENSPVDVPPTDAPLAFALGAPRPNPAEGPVEIGLALPARGHVTADVVAVDGRRVARLASGVLPEGRHTLRWDGRDDRGSRAAPGVYFLRVSAPSGHGFRKITLVD